MAFPSTVATLSWLVLGILGPANEKGLSVVIYFTAVFMNLDFILSEFGGIGSSPAERLLSFYTFAFS